MLQVEDLRTEDQGRGIKIAVLFADTHTHKFFFFKLKNRPTYILHIYPNLSPSLLLIIRRRE